MPIYDTHEPDGYYIASEEDVLRRIKRIKPYVDKIKIWYSENPHYDIDLLKRLCGKNNVKENPKGRKKVKIAGVWCDYKLDITQPTRRAFEYMIENTRPPVLHFVNNIEMSLDFITATKEDLKYIRHFFERHWVKLWHLSGWFKRTIGVKTRSGEKKSLTIDATQLRNQGTLYYDERKAKVHYKMYSDLVSKVNKKLCCHLEVILRGYPNVRKANLGSLEAYQNAAIFNKFWKHYLQLRRTKDEDTVKRIIANNVRKKLRGEDERSIRFTIFAIFRAYYEEDIYMTQDIMDNEKYTPNREQLLDEIPNEPFLPSRVAKIPLVLYKNRQ